VPYPSKKPIVPDHTLEVVVLKHHGRRMQLLSPLPFAPGTVVLLRVEGELLHCEVAPPPARTDQFEARTRIRKGLTNSFHPEPDWSSLDSEESVMGSLVALNARLKYFEEREQAS